MTAAMTSAVIALSIAGGCGARRDADLAVEYEALVAELCACESQACVDTAHERMAAWEAGHRSRKLTTRDVATTERYVACETAHVQRYVATVQDAAPAYVPAPAPAPEPTPAPIFDEGPGLTAAQVVQLDMMVEHLERMQGHVTSLGCKAAAKEVTRAWQGFTPVNQVIRAINPDEDPALESWLIDHHVRRAFAAVMSLVDKGMAGCDKVRAWNRAVEATDFMGTKGGDE